MFAFCLSTNLNRAAIVAADTTEVSGRVTTDEVNLGRIHNRIRSACAFLAATLSPPSLRWMLLFAVLIVPQVLCGAEWFARVGAQSSDKGRQALAFLPNEIWIHAGDSITWRFDVDEIHTVTFIPDSATRPPFQAITEFSPTATFDDSTTVSTP